MTVVTVSSTDTVTRLLQVLAEHRIGAVVVSDDGSSIAGIVSERDVVRALTDQPDLLGPTGRQHHDQRGLHLHRGDERRRPWLT